MSQVKKTPLILNGREASNEVLKKIKIEMISLKRPPGLAVTLVGDNPASHTYVKNKEKACKDLGIYSEVHKLSASTKEEEFIKLIQSLNNNNSIDGILVQLPLPDHINTKNVINNIDPKKDVDGLHPFNLGNLISSENCLAPCTPLGIIELLKYYSINLEGAHVVIIGRSNLVGKPLSLLLLKENATVTITHSKTKNLSELTKTADILIAACGKANLVKKSWVKEDAIVIDVGINKVIENEKDILCGDVDYKEVSTICKAITPVPGGVGPMTIAMLMANTLKAYKMQSND